MSRTLPSSPNLEHLKKEAKSLLRAARRNDASALERIHAAAGATLPAIKLADVLHTLAREYGFANWTTLKQAVLVQGSDADPFAALGAAIDAADDDAVRAIIARHPAVKTRLNDPLPNGSFGIRPLARAVERKNFNVVDQLIAAGADVNGKSDWWAGGFAALDLVDPALARELLSRGATLTTYAAARLGMIDEVQRLVENDPQSVHMRGGDGQTPLHVAATVEIAEFLLQHGADIDALDVDHESTPAMYHIRERTDVTRFLIAQGCRTDILMAAAVGDIALVRRYLDESPDSIEITVSGEWFPMQHPRAGGTIYIWTLGGHKSAHVVAKEFGHPDVLSLLMERTPDALKLALAFELDDDALLASLAGSARTLIAELNDTERAKIVDAAEANKTTRVRAMLQAGWPADARRGQGATALHWAGFHGNAEMALDLIAHDAPIDIPEAQFNGTPLGWTAHGSEHSWHSDSGDYVRTATALLDAGASLPREAQGKTREELLALLRQRSN